MLKIQDEGSCENKLGFYLLNIFANSSILDVLQDSQFSSAAGNNMKKNLHLRCGQGFEFVFAAINYSQKDSF